jgi:hypothetical protein
VYNLRALLGDGDVANSIQVLKVLALYEIPPVTLGNLRIIAYAELLHVAITFRASVLAIEYIEGFSKCHKREII